LYQYETGLAFFPFTTQILIKFEIGVVAVQNC